MCKTLGLPILTKQLSSKGSGEGQEEKVFLEIVMDKAF